MIMALLVAYSICLCVLVWRMVPWISVFVLCFPLLQEIDSRIWSRLSYLGKKVGEKSLDPSLQKYHKNYIYIAVRIHISRIWLHPMPFVYVELYVWENSFLWNCIMIVISKFLNFVPHNHVHNQYFTSRNSD